MKSMFRFMSIALVALSTMVACHKDHVDYNGNGSDENENIGYLNVAGLQADILKDTENFDSASASRAGVDINNFNVVITAKDGEIVSSFKYGERPSDPIALEGGVYKINMSSATMVDAEWEAPVYAAEKEVVITRKQTTTVSDIVCKLANIKVTVGYSADIAEQLNPQYTKMTVELGDSGLEYAFSETRAGYFAPVAAENTLKLTFNCRYKGEGETKDIIMTNEIKGVKAAQWRKINVVIQHAADGTATIGIVCDTWTYDEEVTFDTSAMLMEEVIPDDTDAPVIVWEGHDLAEAFELTDDMFDADGNFKKSINLDVTTKAALKSLIVKASSDNADFTTAYSQIMPLEEDLCAPTASAAILKMMGYPTDAKGGTTARLKFASQADLLKSYEGTHSYEITAEDINGAKTTVKLTIKYGQNVAPQIIWVGYDIDKRQTIKADDTCMIRVSAPLAIQDFEIKIVSETLNAAELQAVGLRAEFSLVNDTDLAGALSGLGFPVGGEVYNQTLISEDKLNITGFLNVLSMLGANTPGVDDHDFVMTVTDMEGNTTTKTVMMRFE
ncbi:MAG: DUF4493 domain-containing protein [Alistipes sp.]|nr:DUF4493 domain-containing protein [Alistipes sp.]